MRIAHLTPGTGHFYCGSCLRDNALVRALRQRGHDVTMMPLYLPFALEEGEQPPSERVFMGGVNMYLQQKLAAFRWLPGPIARWLDSPRLLRWLASHSHMTDAADLGELMVSTVRGDAGRQAHEVEKLVTWMSTADRPDVLCLSNIMLIGLARRLKETLGVPLVCSLQGEAPFLDTLPEPYRAQAWATIAERATEVDAFVPVSRYYGEVMRERLGFDAERMHVVHNGIELDGEPPAPRETDGPVIGYLARMCSDKGLHTLVDAFTILKRENAIDGLRLHVTGVQLGEDRPYVAELRQRLERAGCADDARFDANVDRGTKEAFLRTLSVLSVPATYGESFGLYLLEALAAGVPVVQPRHGAFPEVLEATGGGVLCEPDDAASLAAALREVLADDDAARRLGADGQARVRERFTADAMAAGFENVCMMVAPCPTNSS